MLCYANKKEIVNTNNSNNNNNNYNKFDEESIIPDI